jgi:2-phospho-L-lactate guanylyltransferase
VPDRRLAGTNVAGVPTGAGFSFSYGAGSFARHRAEAARLELPARIVQDPFLSWDVDVPGDLAWPGALAGVTPTLPPYVLAACPPVCP